MSKPRPKEEILAEIRAEQAADRALGHGLRRSRDGSPQADPTPRRVARRPRPTPGRPLTWRWATASEKRLIAGLLAERAVPANRVARVQRVVLGSDPCPPTLIDWLRGLPRKKRK
jgi:hypothetical protein